MESKVVMEKFFVGQEINFLLCLGYSKKCIQLMGKHQNKLKEKLKKIKLQILVANKLDLKYISNLSQTSIAK